MTKPLPRPAPQAPLGIPGRIALALFLAVGGYLATADPFTLVFFVAYGAVGALLAIRRPTNAVSWLLLVIGFGFIPNTIRPEMDIAALQAGTASTADLVLAWWSTWGFLGLYAYLALTIVFPSGRLPEGRGRWLAITLLGAGAAMLLLGMIAPTIGFTPDGATTIHIPNPVTVLPDLPVWRDLASDAFILPLIALLIIGLGWMLVRYRRASGVLRLQLRWLLAAIALVATTVPTALAIIALIGQGGDYPFVVWIPAVVAYAAVPTAIGIAILRYRLYDIDVILRRTLIYGVLTIALGAVYAATVLVLQAALDPVTQGDGLAVAASTLAVAALFRPVRARIQSTVDRRFNRSRYDASRTLEVFATRLRHEIELDTLTAELRDVVGATMQPSSISIWVRRP